MSEDRLNQLIKDLVTQQPGYLQFRAQTEAWLEQLRILQDLARRLHQAHASLDGQLLLEYSIPYRSRRPDVVLLVGGSAFVLEFKVGEREFSTSDKWQVRDYVLDLRDFHLPSRNLPLHAILVATNFHGSPRSVEVDGCPVLCTGVETLVDEIARRLTPADPIDWQAWAEGMYRPALSIVEAAESLYHHHDVAAINHNLADNLTVTTRAIQQVLADAETRKRRAICFVTGIPGAGKTLVGLASVHDKEIRKGGEPKGIFLSGNSPLVAVVREAIGRSARRMHKREARRTIETFVANVHRFIDESSAPEKVPPAHAIIFDEAQRAWSADHMRKKKRGEQSEPALLLEIMAKKPDWCVIVALVGGGQEINDGEAGLEAWGQALAARSDSWDVWSPAEALTGNVAVAGHRLFPGGTPQQHVVHSTPELHLAVGLRAPRALKFASWVESVLAGDTQAARRLSEDISGFPLTITRSIDLARWWLRARADPQQRIGLVASSGNRRLRAYGVQLSTRQGQNSDVENWFLAPLGDVRSSNALEVAAIEFECQGLELDWVGVCWGDDFTRVKDGWQPRQFVGTTWRSVTKVADQAYIVNTYRVLLTRARQGMVLVVPQGDPADPTRDPGRLDATWQYLVACGAQVLDENAPESVVQSLGVQRTL